MISVTNLLDEYKNWTVEAMNAIMQGPDWNSMAVFITYDDFGGLYDHVPPPQLDQFGLGPHIPLLIISPFAGRGHISRTLYEHSSILRFIETRFLLPPLTGRDVAASTCSIALDFEQLPQSPLLLSTRRCL
jgi:phospholipase C